MYHLIQLWKFKRNKFRSIVWLPIFGYRQFMFRINKWKTGPRTVFFRFIYSTYNFLCLLFFGWRSFTKESTGNVLVATLRVAFHLSSFAVGTKRKPMKLFQRYLRLHIQNIFDSKEIIFHCIIIYTDSFIYVTKNNSELIYWSASLQFRILKWLYDKHLCSPTS